MFAVRAVLLWVRALDLRAARPSDDGECKYRGGDQDGHVRPSLHDSTIALQPPACHDGSMPARASKRPRKPREEDVNEIAHRLVHAITGEETPAGKNPL